MTVNSLLASAWDVGVNKYENIPVYNYVTNSDNPITWKTYCDLGLKYGSKIPIIRSIWYYTITLEKNFYMARILQFFYHLLPAFFMDMGLLFTGKKAK